MAFPVYSSAIKFARTPVRSGERDSTCDFQDRINIIRRKMTPAKKAPQEGRKMNVRVAKSIGECKQWMRVFVRMSKHNFERRYDWFVVRDFYFDLLSDWMLARKWATNVMRERSARNSRKNAVNVVSIKSFASHNKYECLKVSHGRHVEYVDLYDCDEYVAPIIRKCCGCNRRLAKQETSDDCACMWTVNVEEKVQVLERPRNAYFLWKLRNALRMFADRRLTKHVIYYRMFRTFTSKVEAQMDIPQHGNEGGEVSIASNVVIEQESDVNPITFSTGRQDWTSYCANDKPIRADELTNRWLHAGSATWKVGDPSDKELMKLELPKDCMKEAGDLCDTPNYIPFRVSSFSHFESIDIKFLINSNKFQTGSLIASFIYQTDTEENVEYRYNAYSLSQNNHVKLYAGSMNETTLTIPYRNSLSMLYNQPNQRTLKPLFLGTLLVYVVNPLIVGTMVSNQVNINIQMKFNGLQFSGTRPGNWPQAQMEAAATVLTTTAAMSLLNTLKPDPNRDNPPLNADPAYFVPTASHSWAAGTGRIDVNKMLRLDTRGQTTHEISPEDAFTVKNLASKLGLIQKLKVNIKTRIDTEIFSMPVEPMFGKKVGIKRENYEIAQTYYLPPVSVISSCFAYWRGSFKVVLDIVASQFITCKLLCAYIPNVPVGQEVKRSDLFKAPHWIISVEGPKMIELEIPYITNQKWWPRTYTGNYSTVSAPAPSQFYIYMYNPALIQQSSADSFYINLYVGGGESFEVAVPVQPALGIGKNIWYFDRAGDISPVDGKIDDKTECIYPTTVSLDSFTTSSIGVARKNNLRDHEITKYPLRKEFDFRPENKDRYQQKKPNRTLYIVEYRDRWESLSFDYKDKTTQKWNTISYQYGLLANEGGVSYFVPYDTKLNAYKAADQQQTENNKRYSNMTGYVSYDNIPIKDDTYDITIQNSGQNQQLIILGSSASDVFDQVTAQSERDGVQVATLSSVRVLSRTDFGMQDFGENFGDLMNLCRRYHKYGSIKMTGSMLDSKDKCSFFFTCNPQGLGPITLGGQGSPSEIFNRCREGPIPLLLSGYRYFRGSLRFRLVFPSCKDTVIWLQHRPDRPSRPRKLEACTTITTAQAIFNHGYASEIQLANINTVIEIEIPFYQYDAYGLLQDPEEAGVAYDYQYGLGQLFVGIQCSPDDIKTFTNRNCEIYYSLADDFTPSLFYGFPKMIVLDDIPEDFKKTNLAINEPGFEAIGIPEPQGLGDMFTKVKTKFRSELREEILDGAKDVVQEDLKPIISDVIEQVKETVGTMSSDQSMKQRILLTFTNLCHCVAHPDIKSLVITVSSMLVDLGIFCFDSIKAVYKILTDIFKKIYAPDAKQHTDKVEMQGPSQDNDEALIASWLSLIYGGLTSIFSLRDASKAPPGKGVSLFMRDFNFSMRGAQGVFIFIRNSFAAIKHMFQFLFRKCDPTFKVLDDISRNQDVISMWIREVIFLTDVANVNKHAMKDDFVERVYIAHDYGQLLMCNIPIDVHTQPFYSKLNSLFQKLSTVKAQLVTAGKHPHIRKEPFGIYMYGECGIGKSQIRQQICIELLDHVKYKYKSVDVFCVVDGSQKHWDQCNHQPVLVIDDLWNVQEGELLQTQVSMMFRIFSDVVLTPPKAELHDKGMRYNPEIVWITSNYSHISLNNVNNEALNRRRNVCIEAVAYSSDQEIFKVKNCPHCANPDTPLKDIDPQFLEDYHHVRFFVHNINRTNQFVPTALTRGHMYTYHELMQLLKTEFAKNRVYESIRFERKYKQLTHLVENYDDDDTNYSSYFTSATATDTKTFSEQLLEYKEKQLKLVRKLAEEHEKHWLSLSAKWTETKYKKLKNMIGYCSFTKTKKYMSKYLRKLPQVKKTEFEEIVEEECETLNKALNNSNTKSVERREIPIEPSFDYGIEEVDDNPNLREQIREIYLKKNTILVDVDVHQVDEQEVDNIFTVTDTTANNPFNVPEILINDMPIHFKPGNPFDSDDDDVPEAQMDGQPQIMPVRPTPAANHPVADAARAAMARAREVRAPAAGPVVQLSEAQIIVLIENHPSEVEFSRAVTHNPYAFISKAIFSICTKNQQLEIINNVRDSINLHGLNDNHIKNILSVINKYTGHGAYVDKKTGPHADFVKFLDKYGPIDLAFVTFLEQGIEANAYSVSDHYFDPIYFIDKRKSARVCHHQLKNIHQFIIEHRKYKDILNRQEVCTEGHESCRLTSRVYSTIFFNKFLSVNPSYLKTYNKGVRTFVPDIVGQVDDTISTDIIHLLIGAITNTWRKTVKPALFKILNAIETYFPILMLVGSVLGIYWIYDRTMTDLVDIEKDRNEILSRWTVPADFESITMGTMPQSAYSNDARSGSSSSVHPARLIAQSQQASMIAPLICRNIFYLKALNTTNSKTWQFRCIGIGDHSAIVLRHYMDTLKYLRAVFPNDEFMYFVELSEDFVKVGSRVIKIHEEQLFTQVAYFESAVRNYDNTAAAAHKSNICLWHVPSQVPSFRNLIKFMPNKEEIQRACSDVMLINELKVEIVKTKLELTKDLLIPENVTGEAKTEAVCMSSYWKYPRQQRGMCVTMVVSTNMQNPLVGIHVAGVPSGQGYAEILCKEMFNGLNLLDSPALAIQTPDLKPIDLSEIKFEGPLCVFGKVDASERNSTPVNTKIKPTLIHGQFPVTTSPNPLSAFDKRLPEVKSPLLSGVENHGKFVKSFKIDQLTRAADDVLQKFLTAIPSVFAVPRKLTLNECVCGSGDIKYVDALNWKTSAGYPLKKFKPPTASGKKWLFNIESVGGVHTVTSLHPELQFQLDLNDKLRKNNIKPFTVFTDCLKDTCINKDKCSIPGKTRIFSISPVQYTIKFREYFGCFAASFRTARFKAEHAIGINVNSGEWMELVQHLYKKGTKLVTGDYKNFGPGLELEVVRAACNIMVQWNIHNKVLVDQSEINYSKILVEEMIERKHLMEDIIYRPPAGAPSGSPVTDIVNSIVNMIYIRLAWLNVVSESLCSFNDNVNLIVYGDDLIMSVSDAYIDRFNSVTISEYFLKQDIIFTDQNKTGEIVPYRSLATATFLKCSFTNHPLRPLMYLAPLDIESVHSCLNWIKGSLDRHEGTIVNLKQASELLYGHGPEVYTKYITKFIKICNKLNFNIHFPTWLELDSRVYDDNYILGNYVIK